jgi:hypothetical protein
VSEPDVELRVRATRHGLAVEGPIIDKQYFIRNTCCLALVGTDPQDRAAAMRG